MKTKIVTYPQRNVRRSLRYRTKLRQEQRMDASTRVMLRRRFMIELHSYVMKLESVR